MNHQGFIRTLAPLSALILLAGLSACSGEGNRGPVIIKVDGISIMEGDFFEEYDYALLYRDVREGLEETGKEAPPMSPGTISDKELKTRIISNMLIPMAAIKARYKDRIPRLMEEADEIKEKIAPLGANFPEIARAHSQDTNAGSGGSLGFLTRASLPYPIPRLAFSAEKGEIKGPFLSLVGCHLLLVEDKTQGVIPAADRVRASHILLSYEEGRLDFLQTVLPEIVKAAAVEVIDPKYAPYVRIESKEE